MQTRAKVSLIHMLIQDSLEENLKTSEQLILKAAESGANFICLPEYFSIPCNIETQTSTDLIFTETYESTLRFLKHISKEVDACIIGGTVFEKFRGKFYNTCPFLKGGKVLGKYRKMHLTEAEKKLGLNHGKTFQVFETEVCRVGILICADLFYPRTVKKLISKGAEAIFLPVSASGTHPPVKGHPLSIERARDNLVFILKNGNIKSNARGGSTAIVAPWGILNEAKNECKEEIVSADLDLARLRNMRLVLRR